MQRHGMAMTNWFERVFRRKKQTEEQMRIMKITDLSPGDLVAVELNRDLIRGLSLTTEDGSAAKLPDDLKIISGFVKRVNKIKPHGNAISYINVLELLTAIRFNQHSDAATRLEISILEHETKSIRPISNLT
jgi:hypothetical protein